MSDLFSKIKAYADEAPAAGFVNVNYGKLTTTPIVVKWTEVDGVRAPVRRVLKEDEELQDGESLELKFVVNISELNPKLTFEYERTVPIKANGSKKTDWAEIVLPSLEKVFGKTTWAEVIEKQPYVAVEAANNVAGNASGSGKIYDVPKFIARYATKAECEAARDLRYHKKDSEAAASDEVLEVTPEAIEQARSLIKSLGDKKALKMLATKPFGNFDPDVLWALATAEEE